MCGVISCYLIVIISTAQDIHNLILEEEEREEIDQIFCMDEESNLIYASMTSVE